MTALSIPTDYSRIKLVKSFDELACTRFSDGVNALCWPRTLPGDFSEVMKRLGDCEGIDTLNEARLNALPVGPAGKKAVDVLVNDLRQLHQLGLQPVLDCIQSYPRDEDGPVSTDVYSFHADSATVEADTWLCTYFGACSEGLRNEEARRHVDIPETRARLLEIYGGADDEGFLEFLRQNCYDLHYAPLPGARPFSFGIGNLWRIAVDYPGSPVPPCIHRAPENIPGEVPRLLLIS